MDVEGLEEEFYKMAMALPEPDREKAFAKLSERFRLDHGIHMSPARVRELNDTELTEKGAPKK